MAKYDKRDPSRATLLLTRASHHLWAMLRAKKAPPSYEQQAIWRALEDIWDAKRKVKAEEKAEAAARYRQNKGALAQLKSRKVAAKAAS